MVLRVLSALTFYAFAIVASAQTHSKTVAITVDDLPYVTGIPGHTLNPGDAEVAAQANRKILAALARQNVPATGFVNQKKVEQLGIESATKILRTWTSRDFELGNHLYSHSDATDLSVAEIEAEIVQGEATFVPLMKEAGKKPNFLRFPFNHSGDTKEKHDAVAIFIAKRGYRLAPCTIENLDWEFNRAYVLMLEKHDEASAERLRTEYLAYTAAEIDFYAALNAQVLGYEPPEIMLLHANQLNAAMIGELIALFEQRHYRFVTLREAETDPIYHEPDTFISKQGPMWGYRWAAERKVKIAERNVKVNGSMEPEPPAWITQYGK